MVGGTAGGSAYTNMQHPLERDYGLGMPLGKTSVSNDLPPTFRVAMMSGEIKSSSPTLEDQTIGSNLRIPQLDIDIEYDITVHNAKEETQAHLQRAAMDRNNHAIFSEVFEDGTFLKFEGQHLLLMLEEDNVAYEVENFDIEVFEEVVEIKRITEKDQSGNTITSKKKMTSHIPMFFDLANNESFLMDDDEGDPFFADEDITTAAEGTVGSVFSLNNEASLSVPLSFLNSVVATPQQMSNAMQNNDSFYLSKPMIAAPFSLAGYLGADENKGMLSEFESDMYFTGPMEGDPEDCE